MAKFVTTDEYRNFKGYVFFRGKPVEVTDKGTLEMIRRDSTFKEVKDGLQRKAEEKAVRKTLHLPKRKQ